MIIEYINFKGYSHNDKRNSWNFDSITKHETFSCYYLADGRLWLSFRITRI